MFKMKDSRLQVGVSNVHLLSNSSKDARKTKCLYNQQEVLKRDLQLKNLVQMHKIKGMKNI